MAETPEKKPQPKKDPHEGHAHAKGEHAPPAAVPKKEPKAAKEPAAKTVAKKETAPAAQKSEAKPKKTDEEVKIVDGSKAKTKVEHKPKAKPDLTPRERERLALRQTIAKRRPTFRHQQWYEYKRLENLGWRRPNGVDSAMRRHFGYEQSVVRVGFRGPVEVRGRHPSGFREVRVERLEDLARIHPKTEAARMSRTLGTRSLRVLYAEADKRGIRILNRRQLE